jgi:hypothetical protein
MVTTVPVFRALLPTLSRNSGVKFIHRFGKLPQLAEPWGCCNQAAAWKGQGPPFSGWTVMSRTKPQIVGINNTPVPKTDTQETENLDKAISLNQEGASMCSLLLSKHASTKWLMVAPPYIPDAVCPSPGICPGQRFTIFPDRLKALGDELGHTVGRQWSHTGIWKEQGPLKHASHLRWRPEEFLSNLRG